MRSKSPKALVCHEVWWYPLLYTMHLGGTQCLRGQAAEKLYHLLIEVTVPVSHLVPPTWLPVAREEEKFSFPALLPSPVNSGMLGPAATQPTTTSCTATHSSRSWHRGSLRHRNLFIMGKNLLPWAAGHCKWKIHPRHHQCHVDPCTLGWSINCRIVISKILRVR
jgi:hypothetical protein